MHGVELVLSLHTVSEFFQNWPGVLIMPPNCNHLGLDGGLLRRKKKSAVRLRRLAAALNSLTEHLRDAVHPLTPGPFHIMLPIQATKQCSSWLPAPTKVMGPA
jgi:hypothetical protein